MKKFICFWVFVLMVLSANAQTYQFECVCAQLSGDSCDVCPVTNVKARTFSGLIIYKNGDYYKWIDRPYTIRKLSGNNVQFLEQIPNPDNVTINLAYTAFSTLDGFIDSTNCNCNDGGIVTLVEGPGIVISGDTISAVDTSYQNEGALNVTARGGNDAGIHSNTFGSTDIQIKAGAGTLVTDGFASAGGYIQIAVKDTSSTNEIQAISVATNVISLSLGGGSVTLAGAGGNTVTTLGSTITITGTPATGAETIVTAGTGISVSGIGTSGSPYVVTNTGDLSATNELQTLTSSGTSTFTSTLSLSGGSLSITGAGIAVVSRSGNTATITATEVGTVSSVGLSLPSIFSVSGSPVTGSGTLTGTLTTQTANTVFAGPTTGAAATPTFRALVSADIPALGYVTSVNVNAPAAGITASGGPITSSGSITLALANDLAALEGLSSTGIAVRTGTDTWAQRTITGSTYIGVADGNGVSGNPTITNLGVTTVNGSSGAITNVLTTSNVSGTAGQYAYFSGTNTVTSNTKSLFNSTTGNSTLYGTATLNDQSANKAYIGSSAASAAYPGVWLIAATPDLSNYALLGDVPGNNTILNVATGGTLSFRIANSEAARITPTGMGIGTGANPTHRLEVAGTGTFTGNGIFNGQTANVITIGSAASFASYPGIWFGSATPTISNYSFLADISLGATILGAPTGGLVTMRINNTDIATVTGTGLGVGNTAPSQKLHVTGNARITGALYDSNNDPGTSGQILSSTVTGSDWIAAPSAGYTPSGTTNQTLRFSATNTLQNTSSLLNDGTNVSVGATVGGARFRVTGITSQTGIWADGGALTSGDALLTLSGTLTSGFAYGLNQNITVTGGNSIGRIRNAATTGTASNAFLNIAVANTSVGDPFVQFQVEGSITGSIGLDQADSRKMKISPISASPGAVSNHGITITNTDPGFVGVDNDDPAYPLDVTGRARSRMFMNTSGPPSVAYGVGAGTGPTTVSLVGGCNWFVISFTAGTLPTTNGIVFTFTLPTSFPTKTVSTWGAVDTNASGVILKNSASTNNTAQFTVVGGLVAGQTYTFNIQIGGY